MLVPILLALLQAAPAPAQRPQQSARDSTRAARQAARDARDKRPPKRAEVTPELLASAYKDPAAHSLLTLARDARTRQDSALQSYDATTYQRISAGLGLTKFGRDRLAFRNEQATHVRWRRNVGAYVDVTGARTVVPIAGSSATVRMDGDISPIPYYPGSETMWIGSQAQTAVDENKGIVNPLAEGSEAYYTFASGDSATFRLPDGHAIRLRELQVRPRTPKWNLAVGSLWFDLSGGQLVRAAYRMSVPMDIKATAEEDDSTAFEDVPRLVKPMIFPMTASVSAIGVEYGLYQGRFWLPRVQVLEGGMNMSFMRVPFKLEQKYDYEHVNSGESLPPIPIVPDSLRNRGGTRVGVMVGGMSKADSVREMRRTRGRRSQCDTSSIKSMVYTRTSKANPNPVMVTVPCDSMKLANSPDLPASIYDKGDEAFGGAEMDALVSQALSMSAQSDFAPAPVHVEMQNLRYNRIEGLSIGGRADQELGAGYSLHGTARLGLADFEPNIELSGARSDLRRTLAFSVYNHLVSASDWGHPLTLGSSISAFLFGRDEAFYYRASGAELASTPDDVAGGAMVWSLFAEQERTAVQKTTFSLARAFSGTQFEPNVVATRGVYEGARMRYLSTFGLDPQAFSVLSDLRVEAAHGDTGNYARGALDVTASHGVRSGAVALTLAGGTSAGELPNQRYWFLGGTQTVRGERPGAEVGNAFWLARMEVALNNSIVRPVLFSDFGWAGDRTRLSHIGVPMSGAGAGFSVMEGLVRFDVARGINPERMWRVDTYVEARF